jgi:hypothetical protein
MPKQKDNTKAPEASAATVGYEAELWRMADVLRGSMDMDAAEYKHVVLGLIFLKYISDAFEEHRQRLVEEPYADPEDPDEYKVVNVFWVPPEVLWSHLQNNARQSNIGQLVDVAMAAVSGTTPRSRGCSPRTTPARPSNVIVYQRLEKDFAANRIFYELPLIPPEWQGAFALKMVLRGEATEPDPSGNLFLTNIQQLYESRKQEWTPANAVEALLGKKPVKDLAASGQRSMLERVKSLRDLVVINDEAHHVHDEDLAWSQSLLAIHQALPNGLALWLDFSATPKDQNGMYFPWTVVDYPLAQAVEDRLTKPSLAYDIRKLSDLDVATLDPIFDQEELAEPFRVRLRLEFATTETEVRQADIAAGDRPPAEVLLASITNKVIDRAKLPNRFAELYPAVRDYVAKRCFGKTVNVEDDALRSHLARPELQEGIAKYLARKIAELTIERRAIEFDRADFRLSETKPFTWRRNLPPLEAKKTVFNYVATYNDFERRFAKFLDRATDVVRFASLGTTAQGESGTQFRVDYLKPSGAIGFYHPDWVVVQRTAAGEVNSPDPGRGSAAAGQACGPKGGAALAGFDAPNLVLKKQVWCSKSKFGAPKAHI